MTKNPKDSLCLERRNFLKLATTIQAAALISATPFTSELARAMSSQSTDQSGLSSDHPKALTPHEWATIRLLADWIIPADDRSPGAIQAGVPEFIDDWLNWKRGDLLAEIHGGLTWLDIECNRFFGSDFVDCSNAQQEQILERIAYPGKAAANDASAVAFFSHLRDLVVSGFFTSPVGIRDLPYLGNEPQSEWDGCPTAVKIKLGVGEK
jgi:gluconate 2-dehydrogenase gamma chain